MGQLRAESRSTSTRDITSRYTHTTPRMCKFLILAEDRRFRCHPGVDPWALCRAVWKTYFCNSRQGGSTIAMQLVRTILERRQPTLFRKAREIVLAVILSNYAIKNQLPALYLWCAYYGWRMNSFVEACTRLQIDTATISSIEEALLIARLKYPQPREYSDTRMGSNSAKSVSCSLAFRAPRRNSGCIEESVIGTIQDTRADGSTARYLFGCGRSYVRSSRVWPS